MRTETNEMNAKQWVGTPDGFEMFYNWYQTTDQYVTDILEHSGQFKMGDEQEFVYAYYRKAVELGILDSNPFDY